jgi:hypothetical protein
MTVDIWERPMDLQVLAASISFILVKMLTLFVGVFVRYSTLIRLPIAIRFSAGMVKESRESQLKEGTSLTS